MSHVAAQEVAAVPPRETSRLRRFRPDIEGLRAVVLLVILGHAGLPFIGGVDVSFVISGYLVTEQLQNEVTKTGTVAYMPFIARRMKRILPMATLVLLVTVGLTYLIAPAKFVATVVEAKKAAISMVNYWFASEHTNYFERSGSPVEHYWSLSVEEQFYIFVPLLLLAVLAAAKLLRAKWTRIAAVVFGLIVAASLTWSILATPTHQSFTYFGTHSRAWELGVGVLVSLLSRRLSRMPQQLAAVLSWLGLVTIVVTAYLIHGHQSMLPGYLVGGPVLGAALVIAGGCANPAGGAERFLANGVVRFIGRISYSLYLWHFPLLVLAPVLLGSKLGLSGTINVLALTFLLSLATYYGVEKPIRDNKRIKLVVKERWWQVLVPGVVLIVAMFFGMKALSGHTPAAATPAAPVVFANPATLPQLIEQGAQKQSLTPAEKGKLHPALDDRFDPEWKCFADFKVTEVKRCDVGDASAPTRVALVGSSTAWQWLPAMDRIGKERHWRVTLFAKGSCSPEPFPPFRTVDQKRVAYPECDKWRTEMYRQVAAISPKMVIMTSRAEPEVTTESVAEAITRFGAGGAKVVVLGQTPTPEFIVPDCLLDNPDAVQKCSYSAVFNDENLRVIVSDGARGAGAAFIDPTPWFCTKTTCPPVIDGMPVYFDGYHGTATYIAWLSPVLQAALPVI